MIALRKMKQYAPGLINQMKGNASAPPAAVAGAFAALIAYYTMEVGGYWKSTTVGWGDYIPGWLFSTFFTILAAVSFAFVSYQKSGRYPIAANVAAVVGTITVLALIWWPTQQCDKTGGIMAGLTVAGVVIAIAAVVNSQAGKVRRGIVIDNSDPIVQSNTRPEGKYIGVAPFVQIALALIMVLVAYLAITDGDLSGSRTKLLAFAGIGITAASVISPEFSLKSILAMGGAAVSVIGAYLEMNQALISNNSEIGALTVLIAAGIVTGMVMMFLSFDAHLLVRLLVTPILTAVAVAGATLLITMIPIIVISNGCDVPATGMFTSTLTAGLLAVIAGAVTFAIRLALAASDLWDWWASKRAARSSGENA